jgi:hypothetical protein
VHFHPKEPFNVAVSKAPMKALLLGKPRKNNFPPFWFIISNLLQLHIYATFSAR